MRATHFYKALQQSSASPQLERVVVPSCVITVGSRADTSLDSLPSRLGL